MATSGHNSAVSNNPSPRIGLPEDWPTSHSQGFSDSPLGADLERSSQRTLRLNPGAPGLIPAPIAHSRSLNAEAEPFLPQRNICRHRRTTAEPVAPRIVNINHSFDPEAATFLPSRSPANLGGVQAALEPESDGAQPANESIQVLHVSSLAGLSNDAEPAVASDAGVSTRVSSEEVSHSANEVSGVGGDTRNATYCQNKYFEHPTTADEIEFQRQRALIAFEQDIHHFNWLGNGVMGRTSTPPSVSTFVILTTPPARLRDSENLRCQVVLREAMASVDPVIYWGRLGDIKDLRGEKLRDAVVGAVAKYYTPNGWWQHEELDEDDDLPVTDDLDELQYLGGTVVLNGWHENNGIPLREEFLAEAQRAFVFAENLRAVRFEARREKGPVNTPLRRALSLDGTEIICERAPALRQSVGMRKFGNIQATGTRRLQEIQEAEQPMAAQAVQGTQPLMSVTFQTTLPDLDTFDWEDDVETSRQAGVHATESRTKEDIAEESDEPPVQGGETEPPFRRDVQSHGSPEGVCASQITPKPDTVADESGALSARSQSEIDEEGDYLRGPAPLSVSPSEPDLPHLTKSSPSIHSKPAEVSCLAGDFTLPIRTKPKSAQVTPETRGGLGPDQATSSVAPVDTFTLPIRTKPKPTQAAPEIRVEPKSPIHGTETRSTGATLRVAWSNPRATGVREQATPETSAGDSEYSDAEEPTSPSPHNRARKLTKAEFTTEDSASSRNSFRLTRSAGCLNLAVMAPGEVDRDHNQQPSPPSSPPPGSPFARPISNTPNTTPDKKTRFQLPQESRASGWLDGIERDTRGIGTIFEEDEDNTHLDEDLVPDVESRLSRAKGIYMHPSVALRPFIVSKRPVTASEGTISGSSPAEDDVFSTPSTKGSSPSSYPSSSTATPPAEPEGSPAPDVVPKPARGYYYYYAPPDPEPGPLRASPVPRPRKASKSPSVGRRRQLVKNPVIREPRPKEQVEAEKGGREISWSEAPTAAIADATTQQQQQQQLLPLLQQAAPEPHPGKKKREPGSFCKKVRKFLSSLAMGLRLASPVLHVNQLR